MKIADLPTPALLLDESRLRHNAGTMRERTRQLGVALRPHMKTLKSMDVAHIAMDESASITVSTLREAAYFAGQGIADITCAVCLPSARAALAWSIHERMEGPGLGVLVENVAVLRDVAARIEGTTKPLPVWIEVDCGEHRTGVDPESSELIALARAIDRSRALELRGTLTHAGHSYGCTSVSQIQAVAEQERAAVVYAAKRIRDLGIECLGVSAGSTPTAVHGIDWRGVTELRPGVYLAGDLFQVHLASLDRRDMALTVLATVISSRPGRMVIDAGGLALSKDRSLRGKPLDAGYGEILALDGSQLGLHIGEVHQEYGEIAVPPEREPLPVGSKVRVLLNHACMTAAAYDRYCVVRDDEVTGTWPRVNGWETIQ